jgi:hypothetical protein
MDAPSRSEKPCYPDISQSLCLRRATLRFAVEKVSFPMLPTPAQRIVLTGVTRGLGRALAEVFINLGHTILGCGRSAEELARLRQRFGSLHDFAAVDAARAD